MRRNEDEKCKTYDFQGVTLLKAIFSEWPYPAHYLLVETRLSGYGNSRKTPPG